jgi:hypothetical protein
MTGPSGVASTSGGLYPRKEQEHRAYYSGGTLSEKTCGVISLQILAVLLILAAMLDFTT